MKTYDYHAVYFDSLCLCVEHFPLKLSDSATGETRTVTLGDSEVTPIFAGDESDSYPVCDVCGREHDYISLTFDGRLELARREEPSFDRWDICAAHYCAALDSGDYARIERLRRLDYGPGLDIRTHGALALDGNALAIYARLISA